MRTHASLLVVLILLSGSFAVTIAVLPLPVSAATLYVGGTGPGNYTTIRDATLAARAGDTIFVYSGVYREGFFGIGGGVTLAGENRDTTIIEDTANIRIAGSANITGFTLRGSGGYIGLWLWFSDNASIENNVIANYTYGVYINSTAGVVIRNNVFIDTGIFIVGSYSNQLRWWNTHTIDASNRVNGRPVIYWKDRIGGTVPPSAGQVILANVTGVTTEGQNIVNTSEGIEVGFSSGVTIARNAVSLNAGDGIGLFYSDGNTITRNSMSSNSNGVFAWYATGNVISDNRVANSTDTGVLLMASTRNVVANNTLSDNSRSGIQLNAYSSDNTASNNSVSGSVFGVFSQFSSDRATVVNNTLSNNMHGILLTGTGDSIVQNTAFGNSVNGIEEDGPNNIIARNTVFGNPEGIRLYSTSGNTVVGNNASGNGAGIVLGSLTTGNTVVNNTASNNDYGISIGALSTGDAVTRNNVSWNAYAGIYVVRSTGTLVTDNRVAHNAFDPRGYYGIYVDRSSGSRVYHNNIVDNTRPAFDNGNNLWDDGYPSGGNYWSDYTGIDNCSGPAQNNCPDPDGIGDTPYFLTGGQDRYPLMGSSTPTPTPPWEPWNLRAAAGDGRVTLTWSAPLDDGGSPVTNYRVYRGTVSGGETFLVELGNVPTYTDGGLANGQTYYYQVSAKNAVGEGRRSAEARATPATVPGPPTSLRATAGDRQVTLTWSAPTDDGGSPVTRYAIYRGTTSGGETLLATVGNLLTYRDTGLTSGVTYYYEVSAANAVGEGGRSAEVSATPLVPQNRPPTCSVATPAPGDRVSGTYPVTGSSEDPDGTVGRVEIRIDDGAWTPATGTSAWRYDWDTRAVPNGPHTVHARAHDGSDYSAEVSVTVTVDNAVAPPPPVVAEPWFWGLLVLVAVLATLLAFRLWRERRRRKPNQG